MDGGAAKVPTSGEGLENVTPGTPVVTLVAVALPTDGAFEGKGTEIFSTEGVLSEIGADVNLSTIGA